MNFLNKSELYQRVELIRESAPEGRFNPYALAKSLGIEVEVYEFDSKRFSGMLLRGKHSSKIVLSANRGKAGRRFAAAHELVHYFLHEGENFLCTDENAATAIEWQANEGAAQLLMPYKEFILFYENICLLFLSDEGRALRRIAEEFEVSEGMVKTRLQSLAPEIAEYEAGVPIDKIVPSAAGHKAPKTRRQSIDVFDD